MNKLILTTLIVFYGFSSYAQWDETQSGKVTTTDNVGIGGTNTNGYNLHVDGIQRINSGTESSNLLNINAWISNSIKYKGTMLNFTSGTDGNHGHFKFIQATDGNGLRFSLNSQGHLYTSGRIGIGVPNPQTSLHLEGNIDGWMQQIKGTLTQEGDFLGIKFQSGYPGEYGKWAGITAVAESEHSNNTGLGLYSGQIEHIRLSSSGNFGIGTSSPKELVHINSITPKIRLGSSQAAENFNGSFGEIMFYRHYDLFNAAKIYAKSSWGEDSWYGADLVFSTSSNTNYHSDKLIIKSNGAVGIGTMNPDPNFKLSVNGSIRSKEVKVEANWSDFVFYNDYKLRTLEEVEQHINDNGHLPEIPSEAEVTENGINLGEMDAKLLQKIEELTLYLIEQNKQNQAQQAEIEALKAKIDQLENK